MSQPDMLMVLVVCLPLIGAIATFVYPVRAVTVTALCAAGVLAASAALVHAVWQQGAWRLDLGGWTAPLGVGWQIDGVSASLLLLTAMVCAAGAAHRAAESEQSPLFWPLWLFLWGALNALFLSVDLFNLYVALEVLSLAAVALITMAGGGALPAAWRYLLASLLGSTVYLLGVALLYGRYGILDIGLIAEALVLDLPSALAAALISLGLLLKAAVFPLHFWLPSAHGRAPSVVSAALSGVVVAAALYLLAMLWFGPFAAFQGTWPGGLFGLLAVGAMLWGGTMALMQRRLKMLIAYSTVSQFGFALLVLPLAGGGAADLAWRGAMVIILSHGLAKASLFLAAGCIARAYGHDRLDALGGMGAGVVLPWLALLLAGASLLGLPPTGGFVGKWWLLQSALTDGAWLWVVAILLGTVLTAAYLFRILAVLLRPAGQGRQALAGGRWAALPALVLALSAVALGMALPGVEALSPALSVGLDATARGFLLPAVLLWLLAGAFAARTHAVPARRAAFAVLWLAALGGNLLLILAQDLLTFYTGLAIMSFAAWGLVVHERSRKALRAGWLYLAMAMGAELALLTAVAWGAILPGSGGSLAFTSVAGTAPPLLLLLLGLGFGVKIGVLGLHAWLPRAHPVAPVPASAVLSGVMIKAGLLGAWRLLEPGTAQVADLAAPLLALGFAGAIYGVVMGLRSGAPKAMLGWSSVSQMGLATAALGLVATREVSAEAAWPVLLLFVVNHGLSKGALFLGAGLVPQLGGAWWWRGWWVLWLPALSLAAAPLTGGALVKAAFEITVEASAYSVWVVPALAVTSVATTMLMWRFLWRLHAAGPGRGDTAHEGGLGLFPPYLALVVLALVLPWWHAGAAEPGRYALSAGALLEGLWPLAVGVLLLGLLARLPSRTPRAGEPGRTLARLLPPGGLQRVRALRQIVIVERRLHGWPVVGRIVMCLLLPLAFLLWLQGGG